MNKNTIIWLLTIAVLVLASSLITILLVKPSFFSNSSIVLPPKRLYDKLNLSPQQRPIMDELIISHKEKMQLIHDSLWYYRLLLLDELEKDSWDSTKVLNYTQKINSFEKDMQKAFIQHVLLVKKILNPEQQRVFFNHFRERCRCKTNERTCRNRYGRP